MKIRHLIVAAALFAACNQSGTQPADYVDPFIGTGFHGHTYPGATTPFGAVQLSPDNCKYEWDACSGYHYDSKAIYGFSHTHLSGTGCIDLADVLFHPCCKDIDLYMDGAVYEPLEYSHRDEVAEPGYYGVFFRREMLRAELTATAHVGIHRYTWRRNRPHNLVVDLGHLIAADETVELSGLSKTAPNEIRGMRKTQGWSPDRYVYFTAQFSKDFESIEIRDGSIAAISFGNDCGPVVAKVGISQVSCENAANNIIVETGAEGFDFDLLRRYARDSWNRLLSRISIDGTERQKRIFYTALYHTAVVPNITSDFGGDYRRQDGTVSNQTFGKGFYSTLSLWDTFRAWLPLAGFVYPQLLHDVVFSCLDMYQATGELPVWPLFSGETDCMIGYHSIPFIVDAYEKGLLPELDTEYALKAMVESSNSNENGSDYYTAMGYIPSNRRAQSVSTLLEYCYDDWCIARFAEETGREDVAQEYYARAANYVNVFDGATGFFRGKTTDGTFTEPFDSFLPSREFTEATAWQYRYFVPHDFYGLNGLLGGGNSLADAVDDCFDAPELVRGGFDDITGLMGQYAHGNEPSHHMAFMYNYAGQAWKTQDRVRKILETLYTDRPDGICGNEDCGQMSAWYVMASMGLYEVCPGSGEFALTSPLFDETRLAMPSGRELVIKVANASRNRYVKSARLDGRLLDRPFLNWEDIVMGGTLEFELVSRPVKDYWNTPWTAYSMTSEDIVSIPYYRCSDDISIFQAPAVLELGCRTDGAQIHYTTDGTEPSAFSPLYTEPLELTGDVVVKAVALKEGMRASRVMSVKATKAVAEKPLDHVNGANGVSFRYYHGDFSCTSDILAEGEFVKSGKLTNFSLDPADRDDYYGLIFNGCIRIPESGIWTFGLRCDDGGVLYIGDKLVVDNDGTHAVSFVTGKVLLEEGYYPFELRYIESYEGQELTCKWLRGTEFEDIPDDCLFIE